jgi:hypothetical protein
VKVSPCFRQVNALALQCYLFDGLNSCDLRRLEVAENRQSHLRTVSTWGVVSKTGADENRRRPATVP